MTIHIVTDSASDITQEEAVQLGVTVIPITSIFEDGEYLDGVDMTHEQFFEKLVESAAIPKTSQISPAEYARQFSELLQDSHDQVIYISLSSELSGCYQSARNAHKELSKQERKRCFIVDSLNATVGQQILVRYAVELREEGIPVHRIAKAITKRRKDVRLVALLDTLEFLKKGGRINAAVAFAGTVLNIKPVVAVEKGKVVIKGKARGSKAGNNLLNQLIEKDGGIDWSMPCRLAYSGLSDRLLRKYLKDNVPVYGSAVDDMGISTVGCVIGTHAGPGAIAVSYFAAK